jgi:tetratricopeptide (TPR) repeat protein
VVKHDWPRPSPNLVTGPRTTINGGNTSITGPSTTAGRGNASATGLRTALSRGNAVANDRRLYHRREPFGWDRYGARYGWAGYFAYGSGSNDPQYSNYYPSNTYGPYYYDYPYYGSYPSGDSSVPSGSPSDSGASGSASQAAAPPPAPGGDGAADTDKESAAAGRRMGLARQAFRKGDYAEAQAECERAIGLLPGDANLHEFRALCQFARGQYQDAAATLYEVLAAGPGWHWDTLSSFYPGAQTYTRQLRALERYVRGNPKDAAGRLVLAYHYLALDERAAAAGQLREVVKLQPRDEVSPGILEALEEAKGGKDGAPARRPAPGR